MANQLPVSKLIQVTVTITPTAAQGPNLNSAIIVGDSAIIDVQTRYRSYSGLTGVATDFGTTAPEYLAAAIFFGQNPQPTQLYIGRWAKTATNGLLFGGALTAAQQLLATWNAITAGAFLVIEDGVPYNISGLNFGSATNLNGVASTIQTALVAAEASSTCVWNSNYGRFQFGSGSTGLNSSLSFLKTPAAIGSATFSANPANADTLTIDGTAVEFVTSGATGNEVNIGTSLAVTLASLVAFLNASADAHLSLMTYTVTGSVLYITSKLTGTAGDSYTLAKLSTAIAVSGADLTGGAGTDISAMLGATSTFSGAYAVGGIAAESAIASVQAIEQVFANWYGLTFAAGANNADIADSDHLAIAAYIEGDGNRHLYGLTTGEAAALIAPDTTSIGALLHAAGYNRTFAQWSSQNPFACASLLGLGVTVNFNASNSTINFMWQQEPGVTAENLNTNQSAALDSNCYNYFAAFNNGASITVNGQVASGHYIDEIWNADWFGSTIQTACFNLLLTVGTKIPQTDAGMHTIAVTIKSVCVAAVNNGFLGPGTWNSNGFGQISEGDFLQDGYYIYQPPISSQSQSARAARQSVPFQVAAKEAGAVNDIQVNVVVNQ
jgi:hypothetical protein